MGSTGTADPSIAGTAYAIVQDAGRQYRVSEGDEVLVDLKDGVNPGDSISFDKVLLVRGQGGVRVGSPLVDGAKVSAEVVVAKEAGKKVVVFKYRRRKDSRVKNGHRQKYTRIRINQIQA